MGRKPVLAVAGTLITSLALAGCQTTSTQDKFMPPNAAKMQTTYGPANGAQPGTGPSPNGAQTGMAGSPQGPVTNGPPSVGQTATGAAPSLNPNANVAVRPATATPGTFQPPGAPTPAGGTMANGMPSIPAPATGTGSNLSNSSPNLSIPAGNSPTMAPWQQPYTPTSMNAGPSLGSPPVTTAGFIASGNQTLTGSPNLAPAGGMVSQAPGGAALQTPSPFMQPAPQTLGGGQPMAPSSFANSSPMGGAPSSGLQRSTDYFPPAVPPPPQGASSLPSYTPVSPASTQQGYYHNP